VLPAHVTGATLLWLLCAVNYVWLEPLAGGFASLFYALLLSSAQRFYATTPHALAIAGFVHALSWFMQLVPGHMLSEQRRPALADSLFASLILAPFFVVMEVRPASAARIFVACRVPLAAWQLTHSELVDITPTGAVLSGLPPRAARRTARAHQQGRGQAAREGPCVVMREQGFQRKVLCGPQLPCGGGSGGGGARVCRRDSRSKCSERSSVFISA
jgi:hypothetical protein